MRITLLIVLCLLVYVVTNFRFAVDLLHLFWLSRVHEGRFALALYASRADACSVVR